MAVAPTTNAPLCSPQCDPTGTTHHILPSLRLPVEATSFVGRRRELAHVMRRLTNARLVSLVGPGGSPAALSARRVLPTRRDHAHEGQPISAESRIPGIWCQWSAPSLLWHKRAVPVLSSAGRVQRTRAGSIGRAGLRGERGCGSGRRLAVPRAGQLPAVPRGALRLRGSQARVRPIARSTSNSRLEKGNAGTV